MMVIYMAVAASNSRVRVKGFSPNQWDYGMSFDETDEITEAKSEQWRTASAKEFWMQQKFRNENVNMSGGSRTNLNPLGDGSLMREVLGNAMVASSVAIILILLQAGKWFSVENPQSSYLWLHPLIRRLLHKPGVRMITLRQCMYGLRITPQSTCLLP